MTLILQLVGIVAALTGLVVSYLFPSYKMALWIGGGVALACFIAYIWLDRRTLKEAVSQRSTLYSLNSLFKVVLVIAIGVMLNLIFTNYEWKVDLTKNNLHTLSDQTVKVVKDLQQPVTIRAFVAAPAVPEYKKVFDRYTYVSPNVKVEFMDVYRDPLLAKNYNVTQLDTLLVESDKRVSRIENLAGGPQDPKIEEKITNAILNANKENKIKAYFLTGHGERSITEARQGSYSEIKGVMQEGRFETAELKLVDKSEIPADAEVIVIAAPKSEFMPHEIKALDEYLTKRAGSVFLLVEPDTTPSLQGWLAKYGVAWKPKKTVFEVNELRRAAQGNPVVPFIEKYSTTHSITKEANMPTILQLATPVEKAEKTPDGYTVETLMSTSSASFEVAFQGRQLQLNEKTDRKGPLSVAVAVTGKSEALAGTSEPKSEENKADSEPKKAEFRLVVAGDADFPANGIRNYGMNSDMFLNMMSWLSSEEELISIRPKPTDTAELELKEVHVRGIQLASMAIAPLGLFLSALLVWLYRRRR